MKKLLLNLLRYASLPLATAVLLGQSQAYQSSKAVTEVNIQLQTNQNNYFLDVKAVRGLIGVDQYLIGAERQEIGLQYIEDRLLSSSFVKQANAYFGVRGELNVVLELHQPVVRVLTDDQVSFYIDETGRRMHLSSIYSARSILVRGPFQEPLSADTLSDPKLTQLLPFLRTLYKNPFWRAQVSEVVVDAFGDITLYPEFGRTPVEFGGIDRAEEKLANLMLFYQQVLPRTGWDYYERISLKYKNQIVATQKTTS